MTEGWNRQQRKRANDSHTYLAGKDQLFFTEDLLQAIAITWCLWIVCQIPTALQMYDMLIVC